jgi:hypothetical protein
LQRLKVKQLGQYSNLIHSAEEYTKFNQDIVAPVRIMLATETEESKQEIWNTVTDQAIQRFADKNTGRIKLVNEAKCIVGLRH